MPFLFLVISSYHVIILVKSEGLLWVYSQFKVRGDRYTGHYANGMTMACSESVEKCKLIHSDENKSVYESSDGYKITCLHIKRKCI